MKRLYLKEEQCCGCTACASVCTHDAIQMVPDDKGFSYPIIDNNKCIDCGACTIVCNFRKNYKRYGKFIEIQIYGARSNKKEELELSQTGALSSSIIQLFLKKPGVVYGALYNEKHEVIHKRATTSKECEPFRGSKYIQSNLNDIFLEVKTDLKNGLRVLFFGTPCQISGLKSYLPLNLHHDLLVVDLICHSISSPKVWKEYLNYLEKKYHSSIQKANLRDKKFGWHVCAESYQFENGKQIISTSYDFLYFTHLITRPSCTNCPFTNLKRVGDITIGDFWGWEKHHNDWNDLKGVNLLIINTEKGDVFFNSLKNSVDYIQSEVNECVQPQLKEPIKTNPNQDSFFGDFNKFGFEYVGKKYGNMGLWFRTKSSIKRIQNIIKDYL